MGLFCDRNGKPQLFWGVGGMYIIANTTKYCYAPPMEMIDVHKVKKKVQQAAGMR